MTLTLTIANVDRLDNGSPTSLTLDARGGMIGRAASCDWSLPDPRHVISSRHCQVTFREGVYTLTDVSTNGTLLNGAGERMAEPRRVESGDRFRIGHYEIVATLDAGSAGAGGGWDPWGAAAPAAPAASGWVAPAAGWDRSAAAGSGWDRAPAPAPPPPPPPPPPPADWGAPPAAAWPEPTPIAGGASDGWDIPVAPPAAGSAGGDDWLPAPAAPPPAGWPPAGEAPPAPAPDFAAPLPSPSPAPPPDDWPAMPPPSAANPFGWDEPAAMPSEAPAWPAMAPPPSSPPPRDDIWARIASDNAVDWSRGGFGDAEEPVAAPRGPTPPPDPWSPPAAPVPAATPARDQPTLPPGPMPIAGGTDPTPIVDAFALAAGLKPGQLKAQGVEVIERAGALIRQLVAGLVVMVEARARAKSQLGAEATSLNFEGNNPIKFARAPDQALAQLLNPKERGFMDADAAVEDAFHDLQSHQIATLKAMQGALRATLDRFSPAAIKARAESKGLMARIMPGAREAALWQAYEREFGGVAQGSDEAFMDVFAKEFRRAYEDQAGARRSRR